MDETAGEWGTAVELALPPGSSPVPMAQLGSVSCSSPGDCTAVGYYEDNLYPGAPLAATDSAGNWLPATAVQLPPGASTTPGKMELVSVWCGSPGNCTAVGNFFTPPETGGPRVFSTTQVSGAWDQGEALAMAPGGDSASAYVTSLSCAGTGNCAAVGSYTPEPGDNSRALVVTESAGAWGAVSQSPCRRAASWAWVTACGTSPVAPEELAQVPAITSAAPAWTRG